MSHGVDIQGLTPKQRNELLQDLLSSSNLFDKNSLLNTGDIQGGISGDLLKLGQLSQLHDLTTQGLVPDTFLPTAQQGAPGGSALGFRPGGPLVSFLGGAPFEQPLDQIALGNQLTLASRLANVVRKRQQPQNPFLGQLQEQLKARASAGIGSEPKARAKV